MNQRYRFFFPGKDWGVLTHSLWAIFVFFFRVLEKKNKLFFFFPRKSLQATHSAERRSTSKKRSKTVKNGTFCRISFFFVVFFFPAKSCFFFFPRKSLPVTHSLDFRGWEKKKQRWKKKNTIFTHSLEKPQKGANFNLFRVKKKYGTFAISGLKVTISVTLVDQTDSKVAQKWSKSRLAVA